jgi:hypothetical protein
MSAISMACVGRHPRRSWVSALDVGLSIDAMAERKPKWSPASSAAMLTTGSFNWRPMVSAVYRKGTPSSPAPCSRDSAGAASTASRNRRAASSRCTAGQRFDPSPTKADAPFARAMPIRVEMKPALSPSPRTERPTDGGDPVAGALQLPERVRTLSDLHHRQIRSGVFDPGRP